MAKPILKNRLIPFAIAVFAVLAALLAPRALLAAEAAGQPAELVEQAEPEVQPAEAETPLDAEPEPVAEPEPAPAPDSESEAEPAEEEEAPLALASTDPADYPANSLGFFQWIGDSQAAAVLDGSDNKTASNGDVLQDYTILGADGDATSLEYMKASLDAFATLNALRVNAGLAAFDVSPYLMAVSQVQANWRRARKYSTESIVSPYRAATLSAEAFALEWKGVVYDDWTNPDIDTDTIDKFSTYAMSSAYKLAGVASTKMGSGSWEDGRLEWVTWSQTVKQDNGIYDPYYNNRWAYEDFYAKFKEFCVAQGKDFWSISNCSLAAHNRYGDREGKITYDSLPYKVRVFDGARLLVEGTDYSVAYSGSNVNAGTVTATVTGMGRYTGSKSLTYTILPRTLKLGETYIRGLADLPFTGSTQTQEPSVQESITACISSPEDKQKIELDLVKGRDYELSFSNNVGPGQATVTVTGKGNFTGSTSATFAITPKADRVEVAEIPNRSYDSALYKPAPVVTATTGGVSRTLVAGTDYKVSYSPASPRDAGEVTVTITGLNGWIGKDEVITTTYRIEPLDISAPGCVDFAAIADKTYNGNAHEPPVAASVTLKNDNGTDKVPTNIWSLVDREWTDNVNAGTATVRITAKEGSNYTGTASTTFTINPKNIANGIVYEPSAITPYTYDGTAKEPAVQIYNKLASGTVQLAEGVDYTISYEDNVDAGTGGAEGTPSIVVTGRGNFTGTARKYFTITGKHVSELTFDPIANQEQTGMPVHPKPVVKDGAKTLSEGVDYTLSYDHEKNPDNLILGTGFVKVSGMGNYRGSKTLTFKVVAPVVPTIDISTGAIAPIADQTFDGSAKTPPVTVSFEGATLVEGDDYTVKYANNKNPGTATVTVTGKGSYAGTLSATFQIRKFNLADAVIAPIPDQPWTGKAIEPKPAVTLSGSTLVLGTDYTLSYKDNVSVGTATVTATAPSSSRFAGSVSATFRIVAAPAPEPFEVWRRLGGKNALGTMQLIVREGFAGADTVVVATSATYKDALSAAALAGKNGAPILLTSAGSLSQATRSEIARLKAKRAIIVGGPVAVSEGVASEIRGMGLSVERVAGASAAATSREITAKVGNVCGTVIIATSADFADALSIAPWSYANQAPIILTASTGRLHDASYALIEELGFEQALIVGGPAAVSEETEQGLAKAGLTVTRLGGSSAVGTSAKIASWELAHGFSIENVGVATRHSYKDALTGAALMGRLKGPILLVTSSNNRNAINAAIKGKAAQVKAGYVFGGELAVSKENWGYITTLK